MKTFHVNYFVIEILGKKCNWFSIVIVDRPARILQRAIPFSSTHPLLTRLVYIPTYTLIKKKDQSADTITPSEISDFSCLTLRKYTIFCYSPRKNWKIKGCRLVYPLRNNVSDPFRNSRPFFMWIKNGMAQFSAWYDGHQLKLCMNRS